MYRVELKAVESWAGFWLAGRVPNVPCGVERLANNSHSHSYLQVPNVPCGVERDG